MRDRARAAGVLLLFLVCGFLIAPFSYGDKHVLVPPGKDLDAVQQSLLMARGMDALVRAPRSYYDTDILYPDKNQLRTTEPLLGFALLGLPLRAALHVTDADVFAIVRWAVVVTSLCYAYLFFRSIGVDLAVAVAGALLCLAQPGLINGIERLQVVSIPLLFPVLYHWRALWTTRRLGHGVGLFAFAALYPLCGVINAVVLIVAGLFALPLLIATLAGEHRRRLVLSAVPLVLAGAVDTALLAPWLLDRSDLSVYVTDAFLQIKHWNTADVPTRVSDLVGFVGGRIGPGFVVAIAALGAVALVRRAHQTTTDGAQTSLGVLAVAAFGLSLVSSPQSARPLLSWLRLGFQVLCYATLLLFWLRQMRLFASSDQKAVQSSIAALSAGLGVFLCLASFGPAYTSNGSPLATHLMRTLVAVLPPLKSIREFDRIWIIGVLFLSLYLTVRLATAMRTTATTTRALMAVAVGAVAMTSVYARPLVASTDIEAPQDFMALASHSRGVGAIYVHPYMKWNSLSGVRMIAIARSLKRPVVNGYLGIEPPWFEPASRALHRFPDPEALWLLRNWRVETVVSLVGDARGNEATDVNKVFENGSGVVYEVIASAGSMAHPSVTECLATDARVRLDAATSPLTRAADGASVTVTAPRGFSVKRMEISFRPSAVEQMPDSIAVYSGAGGNRVRLNQDRSGDWVQSLAADALVRRRFPVATIGLNPSPQQEFEVAFQKSDTPPLAGIALCGEWTR
jgi:hypothetical protein